MQCSQPAQRYHRDLNSYLRRSLLFFNISPFSCTLKLEVNLLSLRQVWDAWTRRHQPFQALVRTLKNMQKAEELQQPKVSSSVFLNFQNKNVYT